jgi:hypothetical protein
MKIFLDTEFTNFETPDLISIGLISENSKTFYRESSSYSHVNCSDFVMEKVVPLLSEKAIEQEQIKIELVQWLKGFSEDIYICVDSSYDENLFNKIIGKVSYVKIINLMELIGIEIKNNIRLGKININDVENLVLELKDCFSNEVANYFIENNKEEHHALNDAIANKKAFFNTVKLLNCESLRPEGRSFF